MVYADHAIISIKYMKIIIRCYECTKDRECTICRTNAHEGIDLHRSSVAPYCPCLDRYVDDNTVINRKIRTNFDKL